MRDQCKKDSHKDGHDFCTQIDVNCLILSQVNWYTKENLLKIREFCFNQIYLSVAQVGHYQKNPKWFRINPRKKGIKLVLTKQAHFYCTKSSLTCYYSSLDTGNLLPLSYMRRKDPQNHVFKHRQEHTCAQTLKIEHTKNLMLGNPSRLARLWARLMPLSL